MDKNIKAIEATNDMFSNAIADLIMKNKIKSAKSLLKNLGVSKKEIDEIIAIYKKK